MPLERDYRIDLQSFDLFDRIERIHRRPPVSLENVRAKYVLLYKVLEEAAYELTARSTLAFANLFSRLDYIGKEKKLTPSDRYAVQTMRRNCNRAMDGRLKPDLQEYLYDLRALVRFVSLGFEADIPASLLPEIPHSNRPYSGTRLSQIPYVRACVTGWDDTRIFASCDSEEEPFIVVNYAKGGYEGDLTYIRDLLRENLPINLLHVKVDEENHYIPGLIVIWPDYLIDISALAACFREYGHHPLNFFMNRIKPRANTAPILLGNLAGRLLDEYINEKPDCPVDYMRSLNTFFASSALEFCTCRLPEDFHASAKSQMTHIRSFIHDILPANIPGFDRRNTLLEASFICERLGLQGRVDMMQKDLKILIEQKSGKRDELNRRHKEDHFVQMMLYQGVLTYNFGQKAKDMQTFLLYSKYTDGLMLEHFSEKLFRESIRLRNRIVAQEMELAEGGIATVTEGLSTDLLNEYGQHSRLWNDYQEPELQKAITTLKRCTPLEKAYFERLFTFVAKETVLNRTGGNNSSSKGFAAVWHNPVREKLEAGNILPGLTLTDRRRSSPEKGYDLITLGIPQLEDDFLPNFRTGDIVILYAYTGEPDVREQILMKGNIVSLQTDSVTVQLRNGQQNKDIIGNADNRFCIEHDSSDISSANAIRGLYAFLAATDERKRLLLCQRMPTADTSRKLNGHYGRFDGLVLQEKQANDYFLLVGPPGTGKTSCALRYMVEEALTEPGTSILLLSYTNRAVDEICAMLTDSGIADSHPFIRIGHELSCDRRFRKYLLKHRIGDCPKLNDIRRRIAETRLFVGTTTAISNRSYLFDIKRFDTAFIDEASQILEPDLIGILSARSGTGNAVGKFVLIGDYKQLPAIALQNKDDAAVNDPLLLDIGLRDCRDSLFERLYRKSPEQFRSILRKQGRMHPAVAEFPDFTFYFHEHLEPVPLPHQEEDCPYTGTTGPQDNVDRLLLSRRMVFIPSGMPEDSPTLSDKANPEEARVVACLLRHIYRLTGDTFHPGKTVGVIVPYRNQIAMIRKGIAGLDIPALLDISIDTVERYQGSQRDVIIYSFTVRNLSQLNFLTANTFTEGEQTIDRKLNVAITRARKQLLLTGNPQVLGANLTFHKLMEYIRMHNGYIETDTESFCQGNFNLPEYETDWDLKDTSYPLPETFGRTFRKLAGNLDTENLSPETVTAYRERTSYGRMDFHLPPGKDTSERVLLYTRLYMRKQFLAAHSAFEACGNWWRDTIRNVSGRIVFCDFSCEPGASALAFAGMCRTLPHADLTVAGLYPMTELADLAARFFGEMYPQTEFFTAPRLEDVKNEFWTTHSVLSELIVFHFGNLFDRISPDEARGLALQINRLTHSRPLNRYATFFRADNGIRSDCHSYRTFCKHLTPALHPLHPDMPFTGKLYYRQTEGCPAEDGFLYELRTNEMK